MTTGFTFVLDDTQVQEMLARAEIGVKEMNLRLVPVLLEAAEGESEPRNIHWKKQAGGIAAKEWWAHFLARGTRSHGPKEAPTLLFQVDGNWVSPSFVTGIAKDDFDVRAAEKTESRADEVLREAIGGTP